MAYDLPVRVTVTTEDGTFILSPGSDGTWGHGAITVETVPAGEDGLTVRLSAPRDAVRRIRLRWNVHESRNLSQYRFLGDHFERGYGDLEWRGLVPERVMYWYVAYYTPDFVGAQGVETGGASIAFWQVDAQGLSVTLDVSCGGSGVLLGDRTLTAATLRRYEGEPGATTFATMQEFCRRLCPKPRLPKFPVYGGNDWYYAYGNNSDESIRHDAALIREHSPNRDNNPFMVIDAGWFEQKGCNGGPYEHGNEQFPDMPALAAYMKSIDVRPGIWIRPLLFGEPLPKNWQLPENHPIWKRDKGVFLDPSVPEVIAQVKADMRRMVDWGYDLVKFDFTTYDITGRWGFEMMDGTITSPGWAFADRSRTTAEIINDLYASLREAAGDALIIGCNTVGHLGAGLFDLQRTGDDTSGREWERTRKMGVNTLAFRMPQHNTFFAVDADCVGLTNDVPWELNRQWLDVLARSGTPLFVSADPKAINAETSTALKEAFAAAATEQPIAIPLNWHNSTCPDTWDFGGKAQTYRWSEEAL